MIQLSVTYIITRSNIVSGLFILALKAATEDDGFLKLPSHDFETAKTILQWGRSTENLSHLENKSNYIVVKMKELLKRSPSTKPYVKSCGSLFLTT